MTVTTKITKVITAVTTLALVCNTYLLGEWTNEAFLVNGIPLTLFYASQILPVWFYGTNGLWPSWELIVILLLCLIVLKRGS